MSKCIYKLIAQNLDKEQVEEYYKTHLPKDVAEHFGFNPKYTRSILDYLGIKRRSPKENTEIQIKYYDSFHDPIRCQKISDSNRSRKVSEETKKKISDKQKGKPQIFYSKESEEKSKATRFHKGRTPWNKGKKGVQQWTSDQKEKYTNTMKNRGWFKKRQSKDEVKLYEELLEKYGEHDVVYLYDSDERYPFQCDFYIPSLDLFIELNKFWHHGPHPFDENNEEDLKLLEEWKQKAIYSKQYEAAIYTWTIRDVKKIQCAKQNNLNYKTIY